MMSVALMPAPGVAAVAQPNTPDEVAAAFLAGYSGPTRAAYARDLRAWSAWLDRAGVAPFDAERVHVDVFARQCEADGLAPSTIARRLSALSGFYAYALDAGKVDRSPLAMVRRPRVGDDSQTLGLDRQQLARLLDVAEASSARDYALVALLALNGLRISEALGADVDDLGHERGHRTLRLRRKGGKRQTAPLAPRTSAALDAWLTERAPDADAHDDGAPVFVTRSGRRLDRQAAWKIVRRLARDAGIEGAISPHSCRHGFVTVALDAGAPLQVVQDAAGHADPRTTRRYDRARHSLDGHATYTLASYVAGVAA